MSTENVIFMLPGAKAAADLSTKQFYAVDVDSAGKIALCSAAGQKAIGLLQDKPDAANKACQVAVLGVAKGIAGGALDAGALLAVTADGKLKAAVAGRTDTSDAGAAVDALLGSYVLGRAMTAAAADGDIIEVLLLHHGAVPTTAA
jgi:hypothetical protein